MQLKKPHPNALRIADLLRKEYARKAEAGRKHDTARAIKKDEMLDILDENGNSVNKLKRRSRVHKDGNWHRTVHVWVITSNNEVLIRKRAKEKLTYPDKWDISCAGHVESGSTSRMSVVCEAKEELGIDLSPLELKKVGTLQQTYNDEDIQDNEIVDIFLVYRDISIHKCRLQKNEVSQVRLIQLGDLKRCVENRDDHLMPHSDEYRLVFQALEERGRYSD